MKDTFPPSDHSVFFFFLIPNSCFPELPSVLFACLFLYANDLYALVNLWSKYCSALNVKLNLNSFEKLLVETVAINLIFPILCSLYMFGMEKQESKGKLKLCISSLFAPVNKSNFRSFLIFFCLQLLVCLVFQSQLLLLLSFWMGCAIEGIIALPQSFSHTEACNTLGEVVCTLQHVAVEWD